MIRSLVAYAAAAYAAGLLCAALSLTGCEEERRTKVAGPVTYAQVAPVLNAACLPCHGGDKTEAGYSVVDLMAALGCTADGKLPFVEVLDRDDHRDLLSDAERELLVTWATSGVKGPRPVIHPAGISDPRSEHWHGKLAAEDGFRALRDPTADHVCGRCHKGAPVAPDGATGATDGATPCTQCHTQRGGPLACSTCHGQDMRSYPPRDPCYFGGDGRDPHRAHVAEPLVRVAPFACDTCHPVPRDTLFGGQHANGTVDVDIVEEWLGEGAGYDPESESCSVACHSRQGERAQPTWQVEAPLDCQSCHLSPPEAHPKGTCDTCHRNMGADPDSLMLSALHINGTVDVGDGKGTCGSCHGRDASGAPYDLAHVQHLGTKLTTPPSCDTCHPTPTLGDLREPDSHMNGTVDVMFSGRAVSDTHDPSFDGDRKRCSDVACHGEPRRELIWGLPSRDSASCKACHATPPPAPHSSLPSCGGGLCHRSEVALDGSVLRITESGRALHIDGKVQAGGAQ